MKKLALAISALAISTVGASAADMAPAPVYTKAPPPVVAPVYNWTGFYVGGNVGGNWMESNSVNSVGTPIFANPLSTTTTSAALAAAVAGVTTPIAVGNASGFIGGAQAGYNYQSNRFVAGIETDIQGLSGRSAGNVATAVALAPPFNANTVNTTLAVDRSVQWLGTLRGRLGITATPSLLLYGTGGLAYGGVRSDTSITQALNGAGAATVNAPYGSSAGLSETRVGWTAGAGAEWMLTGNWTAKLEYLHYDLGSDSYGSTLSNIVVPPGGAVPTGAAFYTLGARSSTSFRGDIVRVGVNYKFGGPVVAKY
jgi:outer membrane immunogenic protein